MLHIILARWCCLGVSTCCCLAVAVLCLCQTAVPMPLPCLEVSQQYCEHQRMLSCCGGPVAAQVASAYLPPYAMYIVQADTVSCDLDLIDVNKVKLLLCQEKLEHCRTSTGHRSSADASQGNDCYCAKNHMTQDSPALYSLSVSSEKTFVGYLRRSGPVTPCPLVPGGHNGQSAITQQHKQVNQPNPAGGTTAANSKPKCIIPSNHNTLAGALGQFPRAGEIPANHRRVQCLLSSTVLL